VNSAASCWDALDRPCTDVVDVEHDLGRVECDALRAPDVDVNVSDSDRDGGDAPDVDVNVSDSDRDGGDALDGAVIRGFL
jgi:hypothetical protein